MKLFFFNTFSSAFLKLNSKWVLLDATVLLIRVDPAIKLEERDPFCPVLHPFGDSFTANCLSLNSLFPLFEAQIYDEEASGKTKIKTGLA